MTERWNLAEKDFKTAIINMFNYLKEYMNTRRREMEDIKKELNGTSRSENTISEMKTLTDEVNSKYHCRI